MRLCTATGETIPEDGFKKDRKFCENLWGVKRKLNVKRRSLKTVLAYSAIYKQQPTTHISFKIRQLLNEAVSRYPREKVKKEILATQGTSVKYSPNGLMNDPLTENWLADV